MPEYVHSLRVPMLSVLCLLILSACASRTATYMIPYVGPAIALHDQISAEQKQKLSQKIMTDPDLPAWNEAREKIVMATGDRVFTNDVDSVYKAVITAVATLEVQVNSAEKDAGFLSGTGKILPPAQAAALRRERMVEFARANGLNPKSADPGPFFDPSTTAAVMEAASGITITVAPHGEGQTKVKARFSQIYYPRELEECYGVLWQAIDKQGFLDKALDAPLGSRGEG